VNTCTVELHIVSGSKHVLYVSGLVIWKWFFNAMWAFVFERVARVRLSFFFFFFVLSCEPVVYARLVVCLAKTCTEQNRIVSF